MTDIELINYVQENPNLFEEKTDVTKDFIKVNLKAIMQYHGFSCSQYRTGRSILETILLNIDKDFNLITENGHFVFYFFRDGVTRQTLKERYEAEQKEKLKK